ncbi:MAG: acetate--CoA ligase [Candidatus Paceibacterota bacterium]|jgi:acetyl-CoA synthetase
MKKIGDYYFPENTGKETETADRSAYERAVEDPVKFWEEIAGEIFWFKKWDKAFTHNPPRFEWFSGGEMNITSDIFENNHLGFENIKEKTALIWEPEVIGEEGKKFTYGDLLERTNRLANALKKLGVKKGDRVGIYLPMVPEAIISMLACSRIGAVHSVVFSAFSPESLKLRLQDAGAKILITADGYYRRGQIKNLKQNADKAREGTKIEKVIVVKRAGNEVPWDKDSDFWYEDLVSRESDICPAERMGSEDMHFILYTSGSTGKPKGCIHHCGGYAVQAFYTGRRIFKLGQDSVFWSTADVGWVTGHTYSCYSPLICGSTFVIFEGALDFPEPDRWVGIIEKYGVTAFYTAPTAIRMFEQARMEDRLAESRLKTLKILGSVGEPIDRSAWEWYFKEVGKEKCPLLDTWWQTETGGILITSLPDIGPLRPSFIGLPLPGVSAEILDEEGKPCLPGKTGNLVLLPPFPPSLSRGIYNDEEKYIETYWSKYGNGVYFSSDAAYRDDEGMIRVVGRVDDVIKVAGHRVSTGEMEAAINFHPLITECAVIGVPDPVKGEVPMAFVVYRGASGREEIKKQLADQIKKDIGPIALPKKIYLVDDLPKTRSGKIMRRILRNMIAGEDIGDLSTLSDPESVDKIKEQINHG